MKYRRFITLIALFLITIINNASAATSPWISGNESQVRLIGSGLTAGVQFTLKPGWKIYWRTPGDAGLPPSFDWQGSTNLDPQEIKVQWPVPQRVTDPSGLQDFVYKNEVIFPVALTLLDPSKETKLALAINYAACNEICIPLSATLSLTIPPAHIDPQATQLIEQYQNRVPKETSSLLITSHRILKNSKGEHFLEVTAKNETPFKQPDVLVEGPSQFRFLTPVITLAEDLLSARFMIPVISSAPDQTADGKALHLTLINNDREASEADITASAALSPPVPITGSVAHIPLILILGFAFLGGLILNVMPCVLPVLSIKLFGIIKHSGASSAQIRSSFLASAFGIITSFLVIAACLILLQSLGKSVGFGFQFQEPFFIIALVLILVIFACNLTGVFEINLPSWLGNAALSSTSGHASSKVTHFLTGAFATILATPCTAPFLGTAISFALSHSPLHILLIFGVMGLGMSLPYLLLALLPASIRFLPKPGLWMVTARNLLGIALFGTALWLIYVLAGQLGVLSAFLLFLLCLLIKFFLEQHHGLWAYKPVKTAVILLTLALAFYIPPTQSKNDKIAETAKERTMSALWKPFERDKIASLVEQGQIVFVDITADWCLTCKINKLSTLDRSFSMKLLSSPQVTAMRADITSPDAAINDYLKSFERYGIPFNVVYGPKAPNGVILPVLIDSDDVISAMKSAGFTK